MKIQLSIMGIILVLILSACSKPTAYGKADKTPYATKECIRELSRGAEIDHSNTIDKLVAYKGKRKMYAYKNGKVVGEYSFSLGKNGQKAPTVL